MIPSQFTQLDALPLTPNGKIDYKHLYALKHDQEIECMDYVLPGSPMVKQIAEIWQSGLNVILVMG